MPEPAHGIYGIPAGFGPLLEGCFGTGVDKSGTVNCLPQYAHFTLYLGLPIFNDVPPYAIIQLYITMEETWLPRHGSPGHNTPRKSF